MLGTMPSPALRNSNPAFEFQGDLHPRRSPEEAATISSQAGHNQLEAMDTMTTATEQGNAGPVAAATGKTNQAGTSTSMLKKTTFEVPTAFRFSERITFPPASTAPPSVE